MRLLRTASLIQTLTLVAGWWLVTMWGSGGMSSDGSGFTKIAGPFPGSGECEEMARIYNRGAGWEKYRCVWYSD